MAKNLLFEALDHSKMHFRGFWMIPHGLVRLLNVGTHLVISSWAISNQSKRPKSRKPCFWPFGSFKNAFLWLLNDPAYAISVPNCKQHLVLSRYAIWSPSDWPSPRNWPKTERIIQKNLRLLRKKTLKINKNFPGHAVFAGIAGKVWIFI